MKFTLPKAPSQKEIFRGIGPLRHTWQYRSATILAWTQLMFSGLVLLWFWRRLPPSVPVWYSLPWGSDRLASPWFLLLPPASAVLLYLGNTALIARIGNTHPMFARILFVSSMLVSILSAIFVVRVTTLVG